MRRESRRQGENTRAVHLPTAPLPRQTPIGAPVWRTAAFSFAGAQEHADLLTGRARGYSYSRVGNPTVDAFAAGVAALDSSGLPERAAGQAFSSGAAATTAVFLAFCGVGAHVLAPASVYGGTYDLLHGVLARFGIDADFVDMTDPAQVRDAVRPSTRIVWAEPLSGPALTVPDLPVLAAIAREAESLFVVDATAASPVVCRPLEHGADLVVHSATKYIGGHSDATGGVIAGRPELIRRVRHVRIATGDTLAPDEAFLLRRGLETLPLRVRRQCDTASTFAAAIAKHPAVRHVDYPGLPEHPGHDLARELFDEGPEGTRFGAVVTVTPLGGRAAGLAFTDALRLALVSGGAGGPHTQASHLASTTHRHLDDAELRAAGTDPAAVRFAIGLEDAEDLIRDASEALDTVGRALVPEPAIADDALALTRTTTPNSPDGPHRATAPNGAD
ncbi:MAG TPA: aminotransferase class I/II-fold pyridoxal phosphate-dependent enzyme [Streptosporangiaceae bacterium]|jgi:cystathionine beta-lyase/cystathionine gamma-synthase